MKPPGLIVIFGPTATGKTDLAIQLAKHLNAPILNADSRQVYRYFDIGTAKPSPAEQQQVPHFLIDIADPDRPLTLADYQKQAMATIEYFHHHNITPILVGGSGFYLKSITHGVVIPSVPPQEQLREQLAQMDQNLIYQFLCQIDPDRARAIHPNDRFRTIRALEIYYTTAQSPSTMGQCQPPLFPIYPIGLMPPPLEIYQQKIEQRILKMLDRGWLEEIKMIQQKFSKDLPLLQTLGYQEMADYLANKTTKEEGIKKTLRRTLQMAKQQKTWFKSPENLLPNTKWIDSSYSLANLLHDLEDGQVHPHQDRTHHAP